MCHFTLDIEGVEIGKMPDASLLAGITQFSREEGAEADSSAPNLLAKLMSQLKGQPDRQRPCSSLVPTGEGLPSLPKKLVDKIAAGEFIDLADLLPAKGR